VAWDAKNGDNCSNLKEILQKSIMRSNEYRVLDIQALSGRTFRLRTERPDIPIKAGQCFNVGSGNIGINREYSMYSGAEDPYIEFLIREVEDGLVSPLLRKLKAGDAVEISGPYGEFCLNEALLPRQQYLFVATGTGIAPFHSFVKTYPGLDYTLLHGVRDALEQYDRADYAEGRYVACVSQRGDGQPGMRVTDYLRQHPVAPETVCYLCGNRNMIIEIFEILREQGVSGDRIITEVFF
jgi:ferredoxin/flavodoxin---NADP+ reductase